jgi:hypothetical protein
VVIDLQSLHGPARGIEADRKSQSVSENAIYDPEELQRAQMDRMKVFGWSLEIAGTILWAYGYFLSTSRPFINWSAVAPRWISEWLPNWPSELGVLLTFAAMIPIYWPQERRETPGIE